VKTFQGGELVEMGGTKIVSSRDSHFSTKGEEMVGEQGGGGNKDTEKEGGCPQAGSTLRTVMRPIPENLKQKLPKDELALNPWKRVRPVEGGVGKPGLHQKNCRKDP